jgi:hypothetical protein
MQVPVLDAIGHVRSSDLERRQPAITLASGACADGLANSWLSRTTAKALTGKNNGQQMNCVRRFYGASSGSREDKASQEYSKISYSIFEIAYMRRYIHAGDGSAV